MASTSPFFDMLALGEQHLLHDAVDLGMDADRERRLDGAEAGDVDRHVLPAATATLTGTARADGGAVRAGSELLLQYQ